MSVRTRFALLYAGAFCVSGLLLLAVAFFAVSATSHVGSPGPPHVSHPVARAREPGEISLVTELDPAWGIGDLRLAESLIANLVDNALRYNVPGGWVKVAKTTVAGCAVVSVRNSGPVVPPTEVERLFQPFQRLLAGRASRAGGHGLGLAIVRAIADAHGAQIRAQARDEGGLDVAVTFPPGLDAGSPFRSLWASHWRLPPARPAHSAQVAARRRGFDQRVQPGRH